MTAEAIYELLHQVLEPFARTLEAEQWFDLDGLLDEASRKIAEKVRNPPFSSVSCEELRDAVEIMLRKHSENVDS